ncbi:hypothetical protein T492DRAFT_1065398 [Pavlovales sp. CCMP2436]|nr:hypothetical protein T492DRAFT_1065398 [Pavlovales sp. CCMP2436]
MPRASSRGSPPPQPSGRAALDAPTTDVRVCAWPEGMRLGPEGSRDAHLPEPGAASPGAVGAASPGAVGAANPGAVGAPSPGAVGAASRGAVGAASRGAVGAAARISEPLRLVTSSAPGSDAEQPPASPRLVSPQLASPQLASPQLASPQLASERSQPSDDVWDLLAHSPLSARAAETVRSSQPPGSPQRSAAVTEVMDDLNGEAAPSRRSPQDDASAPVVADVGSTALVPRAPPSAVVAAGARPAPPARIGGAAAQAQQTSRSPLYPLGPRGGARPSRGQLLLAAAAGLITPPPGQPRGSARSPPAHQCAQPEATMATPAHESALRRAWHAAKPRGFTPPSRPKLGGPPGRGGLGGAPVGARAARMLLAAEEAMRVQQGGPTGAPGSTGAPRPAVSLLATKSKPAPALRTPAAQSHAKPEAAAKSTAVKRPLASSAQANLQRVRRL